jgi:hypothetical protein
VTDADLLAAFHAAFNSDTKSYGDFTLRFTPKRLVHISDSLLALISEGQATTEVCDGCPGELRVTYVTRTGETFVIATPQVSEKLGGGSSWGSPPEWNVMQDSGVPTVVTRGSEHTSCWVGVYHLTPTDVITDLQAEIRENHAGGENEHCDPADDPNNR